jgi:CheY-like chemotaxis protein
MGVAALQVLIVDDDDDVRDSLVDAVATAGHRVTTARHGGEALDSIEHDTPDLILLDLMMPVVDGWEFLRELGRRGRTIPVVVISAHPSPELPRGVAYLAKPVPRQTLLAAIAARCRRAATEAPRMAELVLYVADGCAESARARAVVAAVVAQFEPDEISCSVRDIATADAAHLRADRVLVTPTLIIRRPLPLRMVGGLAGTRYLTTLLNIAEVPRKRGSWSRRS